MRYYIDEGQSDQVFNATNKGRKDATDTLEKERGFVPLKVNIKYKRETNKILKLRHIKYLISNYFILKKDLKVLKGGDVLFIEYPILNSLFGLHKILKKLKKRNIITILHVQDLDYLRNYLKNKLLREDIKNMNAASYIIIHNEKMKQKVIELGIDENKLFCQWLFDYLHDDFEFTKWTKSNDVIIAGNLSKAKSKYIQDLYKIKEVHFNLYGVGYELKEEDKNITYKGKFKPEELLTVMEGSFGLLWDGDSIETCTGNMGSYTRYNNPGKTSLYLSAGLPVIAWKESAISYFIEKNNVGISISKLEEINEKINRISEKEYQEMVKNAKQISEKLKEGYYIKTVMDSILGKV